MVQGSEKECKQALDSGAGGLIIPMIESADQLKNVMCFSSWPPNGTRGVDSLEQTFLESILIDMLKRQQPFIVAMIENINALEQLDNILRVKGLDAILIGPYDLSASMNLTAEFEEPKFWDAVLTIKDKADKANIPCGVHIAEPNKLELEKK